MRTNYIEQLKQLNVQVKEMGMLCENAISLLTKSLIKKMTRSLELFMK